MKIIHYIPSIDRTSGGTTTYMELLAAELGKLVELHIATHASAAMVSIKECQIHCIDSSLMGTMKGEWLSLLLKINPDIIHINCCWLPSCSFIQKWSKEKGYKVVLSPHGMLEPWIIKRNYWTKKLPALLLYQKKAVQTADCLHATAESEKNNLLQLGYNDKIAIIPNGIDVESIELKSDWTRKKEILFLSRVHIKKGINFLIEAVAALKEELKGFSIKIAGEGEGAYIEELNQLARRLGVEEMITFTGGVYGEEKWQLFKNADLFVLPTHSENFGLVVAEALATGIPVITTQGTPWKDLESYGCGWWTEVGTNGTIAALEDFLKQSETELEQMGKNGRKLVEEKYSSKKMADDMLVMYKQI